MLLWCLLLAWLGDPGYVATFFTSSIQSEERVTPNKQIENDELVKHFIATGETKMKESDTVVDQPRDDTLRIQHEVQIRNVY